MQENSGMKIEDLIANITPEIYQNLKRAAELGKWTDGSVLSKQQRESSLQAVIAYELENLTKEERSGYIKQSCKSSSK